MQGTTQEKHGPESARPETAFGRCLVEGDPEAVSLARRSRGRTFGASLGIETLLLAFVLVAPLLTGVAQPKLSRPEAPPIVFAGRPPIRTVVRPESSTPDRSNYRGNPINYVIDRRSVVQPIIFDGPMSVPDADSDVPLGYAGSGAALPVELRPTGPAAPSEPVKKAIDKRPLKMSEPIVSAQLISRIEPHYPPLARQLRLSGTVVLHAIIGRDGTINGLEVVSGSPYFVQAALDAVRQWRYHPTLLDGEPVEVETTITVMFRLGP
jgi:protein TonB